MKDRIISVVDRCKSASLKMHSVSLELADAMRELNDLMMSLPGDVSPPCDVEPQDEPHQTFLDVTHSVFRDGEPVYSGTRDECQCFVDNHFPSGGYGIGPIQG
jgi:hypothetical protein